jgi:membrane protease YdiL (CAAX protease family)
MDQGLVVAGTTVTALVIAQAFVLFGETEVAEVAQIVVFGFLAVAYLAWRREPHRQMLLALALLPLVQLLSLSLPTRLFPMLEWFVMIGIPTYVLMVLAAYRLELRPYELGLRLTRWQPQARIILAGAILAIPGYLILRPAPLVTDPTPLNVATAALIVGLFGGFLEEGLFRGVIQSVAERSLARRSIAVSAFATGLLYSTSLDVRYVVFAVLVGILFGSVVRRTGSIVGVAGGHAALFAVQLVLLPALLG